jgi:hypothetical protein
MLLRVKQHKSWHEEKFLQLSDQRKVKLQLLQNSSQMNVDSLNNIRYELVQLSGKKIKGISKRQNQ